jgi:hypothetical protein
MKKSQGRKNNERRVRRSSAFRVSLTPGRSAFCSIAAAVERKVRAGAGLISVSQFIWPDLQRLSAIFHPAGKSCSRLFLHRQALRPARRRI